MWLIELTCKAEDDAKQLLAPYNPLPTKSALEACRDALSSALLLQDSAGTERRMDIVLSLRGKIAAINERLQSFCEHGKAVDADSDTTGLLQVAL